MENNYCLYMHTAPSGKVYIGITRQKPEKRWRKGKGYALSPHFMNAIMKYGWENIKHEVVLTGLSKESACTLEKSFIQMYDSTNPEKGYNQTFGGDEGLKITPEIRRKISQANKMAYADPKLREEARKRRLGYKNSEESRKKMSKSHMGLSHVASPKWKEGISKSLKEYYSAPENREKHKEHFEAFSELGKRKSMKVEQLDDQMRVIAVYESMKEAYRKTGIKDGNISKCCHGKVPRAGGYTWRFSR